MKLTILAIIFIALALLALPAHAAPCAVFYHARTVKCAPVPPTATQPREQQALDAGYPAPGDPTSTLEPYPPPPGPEGPTWTPRPTFTPGPTVEQPTQAPVRETPTSAPEP